MLVMHAKPRVHVGCITKIAAGVPSVMLGQEAPSFLASNTVRPATLHVAAGTSVAPTRLYMCFRRSIQIMPQFCHWVSYLERLAQRPNPRTTRRSAASSSCIQTEEAYFGVP